MSSRRAVILDVDTGIDDALALAFAVRQPAIELVAVTTLAGNVGVEKTTANTLAVLDLLGASNVPVHRGASRPLTRAHIDAAYFHDTTGIGVAQLPPSERGVGPDRGPAAIIRLATARPGELTLVCVGPLTNLAIALNVAPELPQLLRSVVVMGGAFWEGGNVTPWAEFNVYCDPEAAAAVFETPFPDLLVLGLDVTHRTRLSRRQWEEAVARADQDPVAFLVSEVCRSPFLDPARESIFLHDPLAVAVALDDSLVDADLGGVTVDFEGDDRGRTLVTMGKGTVRIARAVDARRFLDLFVASLALGGGVAGEDR